MKFEEVLPKMRDEGRIGTVGGLLFFKISKDGKLWMKPIQEYEWQYHPDLNEEYLTKDLWSLEPIKVKKWRWVFGCGETVQREVSSYMTEEEALSYKFHANSYAWMERIDHTLKEEEE